MLETLIGNLPPPTWILVILVSIVLLWIIFKWVSNTNQVSEKVTGFGTKLDHIAHNVKVICDHLISKNEGFNHSLLDSHSPLFLKPEALKLLTDIGFITIFNEHASDFLSFIASESPKTKYDVEISCTKSILVLFDKDYFIPIKTYLYNNPSMEKVQFAQVLGIYIRDKYLERHPEIQ
jgi:hypothetical protein